MKPKDNFELFRLKTFARYPTNAPVSALILAHFGFIYTGEGSNGDDSVTCVFCNKIKRGWRPEEDVEDVHRRMSPACPLMSGRTDENVPMSNYSAQSFQEILNTPQKLQLESASRCSQDNNRSENQAVNNIPTYFVARDIGNDNNPPQRELPQTTSLHNILKYQNVMASNSTISASATSSGSQANSRNVTSSLQPSTLTTTSSKVTRNATQEPSSTNTTPLSGQQQNTASNANGPTYSDLGIATDRQKRPEYVLKSERLKTFTSWPRDHQIQSTELTDAGFYYAGYGDCARCFFYGGRLRSWKDEDDVWVEHSRWFPRCTFILFLCAFIRQRLGQGFAYEVQELNKTLEKIPFSAVIKAIGVDVISMYQNVAKRLKEANTKHIKNTKNIAIVFLLCGQLSGQVRFVCVTGEIVQGCGDYSRCSFLGGGLCNFLDVGQIAFPAVNIGSSRPPVKIDNLIDKCDSVCATQGQKNNKDIQYSEVKYPELSSLWEDLFSSRHFRLKPVEVQCYLLTQTTVIQHPTQVHGIPWEDFKFEILRLATYRDYPESATKSVLILARDGFVYIGNGSDDKVMCYSCCVTKINWLPSEDVSEVHRLLSQNCPMVSGIGNESVNIEPGRKSFEELLLGEMDFNREVRRDITNRVDIAPNCFQLGIVTGSAKIMYYANWLERKDTYPEFPHLQQVINTWVNAGFVYGGKTVFCYFCEGGLKDWLGAGNPWVVHAKFFPRCGHLLLHMGHSFVEAVQELMETEEQITFEMVLNKLGETRCALELRELHLPSENQQVVSRLACSLCETRNVQLVFLPCAHVISCVECGVTLRECPLCNTPINGRSRVFI